MAPQIINYDPNAGLTAIKQGGEKIAGILTEAKQAELSLGAVQKKQKAIQYLNDVIRARTEQGGEHVGTFPMFDPVIRAAAMAVAPIAHDYVDLIMGLHEKNVGAVKPTSVAGGYTQLNPASGETTFTDTTPVEQKTVNPSLGKRWVIRGGTPTFTVPGEGDLPYNPPRAGSGEPSANLKTLIQKKNALQATIAAKYPHINLDEVIRQGHGPIQLSSTFQNLVKSGKMTEEEAYQFDKNAKPDPMFQDWLKAIHSFEARAKVEGYQYEPAKSLIPSAPEVVSPSAPVAPVTPSARATPPPAEPAVAQTQKLTKDALIQDFVKEEGREPTPDEIEKLRLAGVWQ